MTLPGPSQSPCCTAIPSTRRKHGSPGLIGGYAPGVVVTLSGRVAPECREFEGTSTSVLNAYLMPLHRPRA